MNMKTILAVVFALLVGIGGTAAYFYFDRLNNAWNAPPVPPAKAEAPNAAPPSANPATNPPAPPATNQTPAVNSATSAVRGALTIEDLNIGGLSYGASINDVRSVHGEPYETESKHKWHGRMPATVYEYPGLFDLYVSEGIVRGIKVDHLNGLKTGKNIAVGSSAAEMLAAYGEPSVRDHYHAIYYVENNPSIGIEFEIEHGFVEEIRVGMLK